MMGTPKKGDKVPFKTKNVFNSTMMASFLQVIVSKKEQTDWEKYVFYCSVSQIHINPEKTSKWLFVIYRYILLLFIERLFAPWMFTYQVIIMLETSTLLTVDKIEQTLVQRLNKLFAGYYHTDCTANHKYVPERYLLARLLILNKKGGLLQLKFGVVGVNIYLWAR